MVDWKEYESGRELCARLSISSSTLYRWLEQGLPSSKFGRMRRFPIRKVNAWLAARDRKYRKEADDV
jgi:excisionase family DNA binding protein